MSVSNAINAAEILRQQVARDEREALRRAITEVPAEGIDINAKLQELIQKAGDKQIIRNEVVISYDVEQFNARLTALENITPVVDLVAGTKLIVDGGTASTASDSYLLRLDFGNGGASINPTGSTAP